MASPYFPLPFPRPRAPDNTGAGGQESVLFKNEKNLKKVLAKGSMAFIVRNLSLRKPVFRRGLAKAKKFFSEIFKKKPLDERT